MIEYFTKTARGYSHAKEEKPCQDFSAAYHDEERTVIAACDGHGSSVYVRSDVGSKFAAKALVSVLSNLSKTAFRRYTKEEICESLRLRILCEWNRMVEEDLRLRKFSRKELRRLSKEDVARLKQNPVKAYGTTLQGGMLLDGKAVCVSLGDGGVFLVKDGDVAPAFEDDDDCAVANWTYSLCQEDAYERLNVDVFEFEEIDGILACTDGVVNPYQSMENFKRSFVQPVCAKIREGKQAEIADFITALGEKIGIGDDVSLALAIKRTSPEVKQEGVETKEKHDVETEMKQE